MRVAEAMSGKNSFHILHLISSGGLLGAERVLLELADYSKQEGLKITIGVFENSQNPNLELANSATKLGIEVQIFPCNGRFDKKTVDMIRDYVETAGIQILHSHNYKSNFYARMALSINNVRWVVTNHGRRQGSKLLFYNLFDTLTVRPADKIVTVSKKIAMRMRLAGINAKKIRVIENGVSLDKFVGSRASSLVRESLGIEEEAMVIGAVGSLTKEKGHIYLLRAAPMIIKGFPNAVLLIVGDGRERASLENVVSKFGIEAKVIFAGMRDDVPEILSTLDVFVLPSLIEGLPMALLEAQAAGVPVIATHVGAIPEVVKDRITGVLIPPKEPLAISEAITGILSDKSAALAMARRGFERVRDKFSVERMVTQYLSLYQEVLSSDK